MPSPARNVSIKRLMTYFDDLRRADDLNPDGVDDDSECEELESGSECDLSDFGVDIGASDDEIDMIA